MALPCSVCSPALVPMRQRRQKHQGPTLPGRLYKELGQGPTEPSRQRGSFVQASRRKQARKLSRRGVKPDRPQAKQPVQQVGVSLHHSTLA